MPFGKSSRCQVCGSKFEPEDITEHELECAQNKIDNDNCPAVKNNENSQDMNTTDTRNNNQTGKVTQETTQNTNQIGKHDDATSSTADNVTKTEGINNERVREKGTAKSSLDSGKTRFVENSNLEEKKNDFKPQRKKSNKQIKIVEQDTNDNSTFESDLTNKKSFKTNNKAKTRKHNRTGQIDIESRNVKKEIQEDKDSCQRNENVHGNERPIKFDMEKTNVKQQPTEKESDEQQKKEMENTPYPSCSKEEVFAGKKSLRYTCSLPINSQRRDSPRQAWNANLPNNTTGKLKNPFPKVKKYRHYPVSCAYCTANFQPGSLRKHMQKHHKDILKIAGCCQDNIVESTRLKVDEKQQKYTSGIPRKLKICYVCGRMFGSKSIKIHEPQCLKKWRIQNKKLPQHKRMQEPEKPQLTSTESPDTYSKSSSGKYSKNLPELDEEAEAAYENHLQNLVPCDFCERTFSPDRVMVHEEVCLEKHQTTSSSDRNSNK